MPHYKRFFNLFLSFFSIFIIVFSTPFDVYAETKAELLAMREERFSLPVASNKIANWPEGPEIGAYSAILMDMNTHTVLYSKNIDAKMYPASTTKILTCLLAIQNCELNENITFSYDAVHDVPRDGSNMGMDADEVITLEQALYGVLVGSANEAASAVGEHVANKLGIGSTSSDFVKLMNDKAKSLGCINSHFMNANGLYDDNHYTCAYDLALIGCEFFQNETLCKMSSTNRYHIPPTDKQPDDIWLISKNQLYAGKEYSYDYLIGSKTGFLSQSRETLVSAASKDGLNLVCVIFMEESPYQFEDTITLFQYGFENFKKVNVLDLEASYSVTDDFDFASSEKFFVDSSTFLSLEENPYIILPKSSSFKDVSSRIDYSQVDDNKKIGTINYYFSGTRIGSCDLFINDFSPQSLVVLDSKSGFFNKVIDLDTINPDTDYERTFLFFNLKYFLIAIAVLVIGLSIILSLISYTSSFHFTVHHENDKRRKNRNKELRQKNKLARRRIREEAKLRRKRRKEYKKRR